MPEAAMTADRVTGAAGMGEPGCILVVEDNAMNQQLLVRQLARLGHASVAVVGNGAEALQWLEQHACSLVLTDCQMPHMDGYEMTRRIREQERHSGRHVPVIALSAAVMDEDKANCFAAGMDEHVSKPTQLATLDGTLRRWLGPREPARTPEKGASR
ncbi:response regulator [Massilia solisilvae]|uniref:Response regulator n=1 Tax=Massilia solisilvae TaxID=1811225 RepID=A0ABT2BL59_9BURK|nr:response regulator [Massilia solisilvae]MCS0609250.1 response regulator [Massilia solisilvae]